MPEAEREALLKKKYGGDNSYVYPAMIYFSKQGDFARAIKLFERYMKMDVEQKNVFRRFYFFVGALYLFTKLDKESIKLQLPRKVEFYNATNTYEVAMLRDWFDKKTDEIAALFDKRNENSMISDEKKNLMAL